jgi:hypothetical protein
LDLETGTIWSDERLLIGYPAATGARAQANDAEALALHGYRAECAARVGPMVTVAYVRADLDRDWPALDGSPSKFYMASNVLRAEPGKYKRTATVSGQAAKGDSPGDGGISARNAVTLVAGAILAFSILAGLVRAIIPSSPELLGVLALLGALLSIPTLMVLSGGAEARMRSATDSWTAAAIVREYKNNASGRERFAEEAAAGAKHGYRVAEQVGFDSHLNIGRTVGGAMLTGGLSVLAGGSRSSERFNVTFVKAE